MNTPYTSREAAREPLIEVVRELVWAYQAFESYGAANFRDMGITPAQFDVIATLGNTQGMTFRELGEKTLITKGTLTGVIDRLEDKGWVRRVDVAGDRRATLAVLTPEGEALFEEIFPAHIAWLKPRFDELGEDERKQLIAALKHLRQIFSPQL